MPAKAQWLWADDGALDEVAASLAAVGFEVSVGCSTFVFALSSRASVATRDLSCEVNSGRFTEPGRDAS